MRSTLLQEGKVIIAGLRKITKIVYEKIQKYLNDNIFKLNSNKLKVNDWKLNQLF